METIDKIRQAVYCGDITNRDVNIRYRGASCIVVKTKSDKVTKDWVRRQVAMAYYRDPHYWLMVEVDGQFLGLNGNYTV